MLPDRISNPGPLTYESGALPIALRGPAQKHRLYMYLTAPINEARGVLIFLLTSGLVHPDVLGWLISGCRDFMCVFHFYCIPETGFQSK